MNGQIEKKIQLNYKNHECKQVKLLYIKNIYNNEFS